MIWKSKSKRENELLIRENSILKDEIDAQRRILADAALDAQEAKSNYLRISALNEKKKIELGRTLQMIEDAKNGIE